MDTNNQDEKNSNKIERRAFVKSLAAGSAGAAVLGGTMGAAAFATAPTKPATIKQAKKKLLMKVGCQSGGTTKENLEFKARHGVFNLDGGAPREIKGVGWDLQDSLAKKEACEKYGISLDAYHLPMTSAGIDQVSVPNVMLGKSPERDREIEMMQQMISVAGKTGVHCLNYNTIILPILRNGQTIDPKRGNASYATWNYAEAIKKNELPVTVFSDSQYVVNSVEKGWLKTWIKTDFKGGKKNKDLWKHYHDLAKNFTIKFVWVRGHANNPFNNRCDELATAAADGKNLLIDEAYEKESHE